MLYKVKIEKSSRADFTAGLSISNSLPCAFILLSGQLVPPGKEQPEGSELLGVERLLLLPLQLQIGLVCEYGLHIFLSG